MWNLDSYTLAAVTAIILMLSSILLFIEASSKSHANTLLWAASGLFLGGLGMAGIFLRLTGITGSWLIPAYNSIIIIMHACLWTSIRLFKGKPANLLLVFAGGFIWLLLSLFTWFNANDGIRIIFYSAMASIYVALLIAELIALLRPFKPAIFLLSISSVHIIFYVYRILTASTDSVSWLQRPDLTLVLLESPIFVICTAFGISALTRVELASRFKNISITDELTQIPNRRYYINQGQILWDQAKKENRQLIMLECDIDDFKHINDDFGHATGDKVLRRIANIIYKSVRKIDLCARIGGEEFIIVIPGMDMDHAKDLANRLLEHVRLTEIENLGRVTISIGISKIMPDDKSLHDTFKRADKALYQAKLSGKDQYCIGI